MMDSIGGRFDIDSVRIAIRFPQCKMNRVLATGEHPAKQTVGFDRDPAPMTVAADRKLAKHSLARRQIEIRHRRHGFAQCEKPSGRANSARKASPPHMISKRTAKLAAIWRAVRTLVCALFCCSRHAVGCPTD